MMRFIEAKQSYELVAYESRGLQGI